MDPSKQIYSRIRIRRSSGSLEGGVGKPLTMIRRLLDAKPDAGPKADEDHPVDTDERDQSQPCPKCGGSMIVIETFKRGQLPKS